ncbi:MAG: hypothetical protein WCC94_03035 [Candidatus Bathyarchaeia archaeon]
MGKAQMLTERYAPFLVGFLTPIVITITVAINTWAWDVRHYADPVAVFLATYETPALLGFIAIYAGMGVVVHFLSRGLGKVPLMAKLTISVAVTVALVTSYNSILGLPPLIQDLAFNTIVALCIATILVLVAGWGSKNIEEH